LDNLKIEEREGVEDDLHKKKKNIIDKIRRDRNKL
jgi:hypothetical protein